MEDVGARAGEGMVRYRQGLRFDRPGAGKDAGVEGAVGHCRWPPPLFLLLLPSSVAL